MSIRRQARGVAAAAALAIAVASAGPGGPVAAASPSPGPAGDPRSPGQGPGFVGEPLLAIGGVLAVGLVSGGLALLYVRVSDRRARRPR